ncbi:hypothetical protein COLO4_02026 [Corchorus olitorius]|uniref:Uncharacterized protein n=1 Tax=Corchorus olitorius TaxID=93759 RepID=A0A1R3L1S0_9ROSI|nr:hypothetical protein COLO4_02026 [Corchorus olitorius]
MHGQRLRAPVGQHQLQLAVLQHGLDQIGWLQGNAGAFDGSGGQHGGFVGIEPGGDGDLLLIAFIVTASQLPDIAPHAHVSQAAVRLQLGRCLRPASRIQIGGRGHQHRFAHGQRPADECGARIGADAYGQVDALLYQVQRAVVHQQVDLEMRVQPHELRNGRRHLRMAEGHAAGHAQQAAQLAVAGAHLALHLIGQGQHLLAVAQALRTGIGKRDTARGAVQQARAQPLLQRLHMARGHGARQVQPLGRRREAAAFGHRGKHLHRQQSVHGYARFLQQTSAYFAVYLLDFKN